jgi:hypothetical protein
MTSKNERSAFSSKSASFFALSGLAATSLGLIASPASAVSNFAVTNCNDTGEGSLRSAIAAQQSAGAGTVTIGTSTALACTEILIETEILISKSISIVGQGSDSPSIRKSLNENSPLFYTQNLDDGVVGDVNLTGLVFDDDFEPGLDGSHGRPFIWMNGDTDLNVHNTRFTDFSMSGWEILRGESSDVDINVTSSTFDGNESIDGLVFTAGTLSMTNTTFFNNSFYEGALVGATGRIDFMNNTVIETREGQLVQAESYGDTLYIGGNIFADLSGFVVPTSGTVVDLGFNIIADDSDGLTTSFSGITNTTLGSGLSVITDVESLKLGTFGMHGGLVPTIPLGDDSSILDYFTAAHLAGGEYVPTVDARGVTRPKGAGFEPGAYEIGSLVSPTTKVTATLTLNFEALSSKLTAKAKANLKKFVNRMPEGATNVAVTVLGYVQPSKMSSNDGLLSLKRAYSTTTALKSAGISAARWNVKGKGKANETGAKARKVVVTVTYSIPAAG